MMKFICGCTSKIEPPLDEEVFQTFDSVVLDDFGFLICAIHRQRLYGWRSVPYQPNRLPLKPEFLLTPDEKAVMAVQPVGQKVWPRLNTSGWTAYQWERYRVWGEIPEAPILRLETAVK